MSDPERSVEGRDTAAAAFDDSRRLRLGIVLFLVALASTIAVAVVLSQHPHPVASAHQSRLPVGQFKGLATLETPAGTINRSSRFVFEAEGAPGAGARSEYWYAYPTTSTVYQINGVQVGVSEFGRRVAEMAPIQVDVDATSSGKLDRVNAVYPRGAPQ